MVSLLEGGDLGAYWEASYFGKAMRENETEEKVYFLKEFALVIIYVISPALLGLLLFRSLGRRDSSDGKRSPAGRG